MSRENWHEIISLTRITPAWLASGEWSHCIWCGWLCVWCCKLCGHDDNDMWYLYQYWFSKMIFDKISNELIRSMTCCNFDVERWVVQTNDRDENLACDVASRGRSKREANELLIIWTDLTIVRCVPHSIQKVITIWLEGRDVWFTQSIFYSWERKMSDVSTEMVL